MLKSISFDGTNFLFTYKDGENSDTIKKYSSDEFHRMLAMLKQVSLANGQCAVDNPDLVEEDINIEDQLKDLKKEIVSGFENRLNNVSLDIRHLETVVSKLETQKNSILTTIFDENEKSLEGLKETLAAVSVVQKEAVAELSTREELIHKIAQDLEKKGELSWESIRNIDMEMRKSLSEFKSFKAKAEGDLKQLEGAVGNNLKEFEVITAKVRKELEIFMDGVKQEVSRVKDHYDLAVAEKKKALERENVLVLKQDYVQNELARRLDMEDKKRALVEEKALVVMRKIEEIMDSRRNYVKKDSEKIDALFSALINEVEENSGCLLYLFNDVDKMVQRYRTDLIAHDLRVNEKKFVAMQKALNKSSLISTWQKIVEFFKKNK
jgi:hypothetical protein